jgi:hypothetical protein
MGVCKGKIGSDDEDWKRKAECETRCWLMWGCAYPVDWMHSSIPCSTGSAFSMRAECLAMSFQSRKLTK